MSDAFDPYYIWLGIPPEEQPPHHYRLLGVTLFENNREVIEAAANRQMAYMQEVSSGEEHIDEAQKILGELSRARICLLNSEKKAAYDAELRDSFDALTAAAEPEPPATTPVADEPLMPPQFGLPDDEAGDDEAGVSAAAPAVGLPQQPHTAKAKKQSSLVPIIAAAVMTLLIIGGGLAFFLSSQAAKREAAREAEIVKKETEAETERQAQAEAEGEKKEAAERKARTESKRQSKEATDRKVKKEADRQAKEDFERKRKEKTEIEIKQMGVKQFDNANIWQTEQLEAFYQKENTLSKESSAADLKEAETLLDAAREKQAGLSRKAQALLAQLDKQYRLKPVPKNAATVLELRSGARKLLAEKNLLQNPDSSNTWNSTLQFDLNSIKKIVNQQKMNWSDLEQKYHEYHETQEARTNLVSDPDVVQALSLLAARIAPSPELTQETKEKLSSKATTLLTRKKLKLKDGDYKLFNLEQKIRSIESNIARLDKKSSSNNNWAPAQFNAELQKRTNKIKEELKPRVQALTIKGKSMSNAEIDEYRRSVGLLKGLGHNITGMDHQPAIDFKEEENRIKIQLQKERPVQPVNPKRAKYAQNLKTLRENLISQYEKLRKDPQVTLALTVVGGELPPEETKE